MNNRYYVTKLDSTVSTIFEAMRQSNYQSLSGPVQFMVSDYLDAKSKLANEYTTDGHALLLYRLRSHLTVYVSESECFPKLKDDRHRDMMVTVKQTLQLLDTYSWIKCTGTIKDFSEWSVDDGERLLAQVLLILALRDAYVRRRQYLDHDYLVMLDAQSFTISSLQRLAEVTKSREFVKTWKSAYNLMWDYVAAARRDFDCPFYEFPSSKANFISQWMEIPTGKIGEEND